MTEQRSTTPAPPSAPSVGLADRLAATVRIIMGPASIPQLSAALAYRTIFSLIPLLLIAFVALRLFRDTNSLVERLLHQVLDLTGLSQIATGDAGAQSVHQWIESLVKGFSNINFTGIGLVSAAMLAYAAVSLLNQMEIAFNAVYGVPRARAWVRRFTQSWLIITLGPLALFASFAVADEFRALAAAVAQSDANVLGPWLLRLSGFLISVVISAALLCTLYLVVPNARVRAWPAVVGGLAGAIGLELAKAGFSLYLHSGGVANIYGSLALLPLFLLWVYLTWLVVLLGLRTAYIMQHGHWRAVRGAWHASRESALLHGRAVEPAHALAVILTIARRFDQGRPADAGAIAAALGLDPALVRRILDRLTQVDLVHRAAPSAARRGEGYSLSRPAERIDLSVVVASAQADAILVADGAVNRLCERLRRAQSEAAQGLTLADLLHGKALPDAAPTPPAR